MVDVLVIGSGGAGLSAALAAKAYGASVLVIGKMYPTNSQTAMAQGGINAALGNAGEDHPSLHIEDTIKSAQGLCDEDTVRHMCADAPKTIEWLEQLGLPFSRIGVRPADDNAEALSSEVNFDGVRPADDNFDGVRPADDNAEALSSEVRPLCSVAQRQLGGASAKRACYAQDYTGLKLLHTLYDTCLKEGIDFLDEHFLLELITYRGLTSDDLSRRDESSAGLTPDQTVKGAIVLDIRTGEIKQIDAKSVVIATGGYGGLYHNHTTNMYGASGDGIAAVLRAGGAVSDMEFVQFHPTGLKHSAILMSESARGEGGYLVNGKGERFVDELKPRDEVARAIFAQLQAGEAVFLDLRHLGEERLMHLLPQEVALCKLHEGVDPVLELVPIKPVTHYTMGGIDVDEALEVNGIKGCFAVGECANAKVHGANRLGGNSLLEITAFGRFAGENAAKHAIYASNKPATDTHLQRTRNKIDALFAKQPTVDFYTHRKRLGKLFYENVGIVRDAKRLEQALEEVVATQVALKAMGITDTSRHNNQNLVEFLEFENALLLAPTIISAALAREESRGAHWRSDYPDRDDEKFKTHIVLQWKEERI